VGYKRGPRALRRRSDADRLAVHKLVRGVMANVVASEGKDLREARPRMAPCQRPALPARPGPRHWLGGRARALLPPVPA